MFGFACGSELSRSPRAVSRRPLGVGEVVELAAADDNVVARAVQGGLGLGLAERQIIAVRKRMFAFIIPMGWEGAQEMSACATVEEYDVDACPYESGKARRGCRAACRIVCVLFSRPPRHRRPV